MSVPVVAVPPPAPLVEPPLGGGIVAGGLIVTRAVDGPDRTIADAALTPCEPLAVAVLARVAAVRSLVVTVYVAVHVSSAAGHR
jgi:hypothetical protein